MPKTKPEDHAYPIDTEDGEWPLANGLTKREYFAAMAMQGLIAEEDRPARETSKGLASCAVDHADALINQLNRDRNNA